MTKADSPGVVAGQSSAALLIVGGGIMGLWAAMHAERAGIDTLLVDSGRLGAGASGGLLGALMPYMPDRWDDKKQFQLDALVALETEIATLETATGLSAGYHRSGRLIALPKPHLHTIALRHEQDALTNWRHQGRQFFWHVRDRPPVDGWLDPAFAASGVVHDTLAARVSPRGLLAVLAAFLRQSRHVRLAEQADIAVIDPDRGIATLSGGGAIAFGHCLIAAGHQSFPLLQAITPPLPRPLGQAVKGQAALLKADVDPSLPVIFRDGLYIVPHEGGLVAVGSTSENSFVSPAGTDQQLDDLVASARIAVPALLSAPIVERWAGLRPKAIDRDPMVGRHPDHKNILALTGGFKISFGLAHRLAEVAIGLISGHAVETPMPAGFTLSSHIDVASQYK